MKNRFNNIGILLLVAAMVLGLVTGCAESSTDSGTTASSAAFSVETGSETAADSSAGFTLEDEDENSDSSIGFTLEDEDYGADSSAGYTLEDEDASDESTLSDEGTSAENASAAEAPSSEQVSTESGDDSAAAVTEDGTYTSKEEVAAYIHEFGHLPSNYISKYDAEDLGWDNSRGNLWDVAPGKSIGGNKFGNYEGLLPEKSGRKYYECDIDYDGGYRNAKRIIYSNDGLVYYTEDHYKSFEQLY